MHYLNANVLSANDTASVNGAAIDSNQFVNASFLAVFGDTSVGGTVQIQASNDINNVAYGSFVPTNWVNISNASATVTAGASVLIDLTDISYRWLRVAFTHSSGGSSTINVNIMAMYA